MTYETGSLTSLDHVLDRLQAFLAVIGWTTDVVRSGVADGDNRQMFFHNPAGQYFYLASRTDQWHGGDNYYDRLRARGCLAVTAGSINDVVAADVTADFTNIEMDVGAPTKPTNIVPASYHFFGDSNCLYIVVETRSNYYCHMTFQNIIKQYEWTGGAFVGGSLGTWVFWKDPANPSQAYLRFGTTWTKLWDDFGSTNLRYALAGQPDFGTLYSRSYRPDIKARVLVPYLIWMKTGSYQGFMAGQLRNAGIIRTESLSPAQTIQIGGHDYMVFPQGSWSTGSGTNDAAFAIQKD